MYKKITFLIVGLFLTTQISTPVSASLEAESFQPSYKPTLQITKTNSAITVDGQLNEIAWSNAAVADNFAEVNPGDQTKPSVDTKALITYDNKNLYIAFIAYDDPSTIRTSMGDRDNIFRDDYIGLMLDTYGDQSWGYELFVNAYGIQGDLRINSNGGEEMSFDIIWESMGIISDSGFQVEIAIPFASLRFPDKENQVWRANFWRDHQRDARRRYAWAAQDRDDPCFLCQWGYFEGISGIKPGKNIEILPNIVASQIGERSDYNNPDSDFNNSDPDGEISLNARYGLSSNSSLEIAINPDFSQVESDAAQIDVNTTFGLFFPETRPFFQEGSHIFRSRINAIYTRSINDPDAAIKFSGQFGRIELAYLFARDNNTTLLLPLQQQSQYSLTGKSTSNILRARRSLGDDSFVGFLLTDRRMDNFGDYDMHQGGNGSVFGFDGSIRFGKNFRLNFQSLMSYTKEIIDAHPIDTVIDGTDTTYEVTSLTSTTYQADFDRGRKTVDLDGEKFWGRADIFSLSRNSRFWYFDLSYQNISPTFRTDNGFQTRNDISNLNFHAGLDFQPNKKWLRQWSPTIMFGRSWNYYGKMDLAKFNADAFDEWIRGEIHVETHGQTWINLEYLNSQETFFGRTFPGISRGTASISSRFSEILTVDMNYTAGRSIWRDRDNPDLGYMKQFGIGFNFKPSERILIRPYYENSKMDRRDEYLNNPSHAGEAKEIYNATIFRTRGTYQFNRQLFLRLIVQYVDQTVYGESYRSLNFEPLLTYKLNPFTKFYIGLNSGYDYVTPNSGNNLTDAEYSMNNRQFFAKVQYLFRM